MLIMLRWLCSDLYFHPTWFVYLFYHCHLYMIFIVFRAHLPPSSCSPLVFCSFIYLHSPPFSPPPPPPSPLPPPPLSPPPPAFPPQRDILSGLKQGSRRGGEDRELCSVQELCLLTDGRAEKASCVMK